MKISMWMLAERLEKYNPRLIILDGIPSITGVRFLTKEAGEFPREYVYIGHAHEMFSDKSYTHTKMLVNGNDFIFIDDEDIETLLNEVLSAIDFYNAWEGKLWEASASGRSIQDIIDFSAEVIDNPICISGIGGRLLAISKKFGPDDVDNEWKARYETMRPSASNLSEPIVTLDGKVLSDWPENPQVFTISSSGSHYIGVSILMDDEPVAGMFIQEFKTTFTPASLQTAAILCAVLKVTITNRGDQLSLQSKAAVISDLLEGREASPSALSQLSAKKGWEPPWQLLIIRNSASEYSALEKGNLLNIIRRMEVGNTAVIFGEDIAVFISSSHLNPFLRCLEKDINTKYYTAGISLPFDTWADLTIRYAQASFALGQSGGSPGVYHCADYAFEHLLSEISASNDRLELFHPALSILKKYDREQQTNFYETLYQYLKNERNLSETAKALYIHRNSMLYRVKRISEMTGVNLNDYEARTFIHLSYLIEKISPFSRT